MLRVLPVNCPIFLSIYLSVKHQLWFVLQGLCTYSPHLQYGTCITKHLVYCQTSLTASQKECSGNCFGGILIASLQSFTLSIYRGMCLSPTAVLGHVKDPQCYETYAFIITKCLGANKTDHILSVETTSNYCLCS